MENPATGGTEPSDHPEPEELAAFIDGFLSEDRSAPIRRHLGRCEDCYEIFMEAVRFKEEDAQEEEKQATEDNVLPFTDERSPGNSRGETAAPAVVKSNILRWASAAAAVVAAIVLGPSVYNSLHTQPEVPIKASSGIRVEALVARLSRDAIESIYPEPGRGGPEPAAEATSRISFHCGVEVVNLQLCLHHGEVKKAQLVAGRIATLLRNTGGVDSALSNFYADIHQGKTSLTSALERDADLKADQVKTQVPTFDSFFIELGQWTEAGYLAAVSGKGDYFARSDVRDYLHRIRQAKREELEADKIDEHLAKIEELIAKPHLSAADLEALRLSFRGILLVYYNTSS